MSKKEIPKGYVQSLYYKQIGYFNLFRVIYLKFLKKILKKKIIKYNTTYNTNYNLFSWDPVASSIFA